MKTWQVVVEDQHGILAIHYVEAVWAQTARDAEEAKGYRVIQVSRHNDEKSLYSAA